MLADWEFSLKRLTDEEKYRLLRYRVLEVKLAEVFEFYRRNGIEPVLIKGWAASRYYPKPFLRDIGDIDLAVCPDEYEKALELSCKLTDFSFSLDIHKGLRHLDLSDWEDLFRDSCEVVCGGGIVRVLSPEDHLRILVVHWLTDGGAYKERLWDIVYLLENRESDFDWEKCLMQVGENRRRWIVCVIGAARKYLGLKVDGFPFASETTDLPEWFVRALEKEWASDVRLLPLRSVLADRREFWRQIRKRIPPNPIQATVEMEGSFDSYVRFQYQIGSIFWRFFPSLKRIFRGIALSRRANGG